VSDGIGRVLLQVTITFVVVGTAYLLLFNPRSDPIRPLTPEQVGNNIAPIGRVSLAVPPPVTAQTAVADPVAAPAETMARPMETAAEPIEQPEVAQPDAIAEPEIDQPEAIAKPGIDQLQSTPDTTASEREPPAGPRARTETTVDPNRVARPAMGFELKPDTLGMHGIYRRTPQGITLYPSALEPTNMGMEAVDGLTGMLRLTPSGEVYLQIISDTAVIPPPEQ
jgi:hypothetical protein